MASGAFIGLALAFLTTRFSKERLARIDRHFTVTGRVRNLTDKVYAANVSGTPMFYLGAPRSFELTLQARF